MGIVVDDDTVDVVLAGADRAEVEDGKATGLLGGCGRAVDVPGRFFSPVGRGMEVFVPEVGTKGGELGFRGEAEN